MCFISGVFIVSNKTWTAKMVYYYLQCVLFSLLWSSSYTEKKIFVKKCNVKNKQKKKQLKNTQKFIMTYLTNISNVDCLSTLLNIAYYILYKE